MVGKHDLPNLDVLVYRIAEASKHITAESCQNTINHCIKLFPKCLNRELLKWFKIYQVFLYLKFLNSNENEIF